MAEEDWEIIPHKILADLRDELDALKDKLTHPEPNVKDVVDSMADLKSSIAQLNNLFKSALEHMDAEGDAGHYSGNKIIESRLVKLEEQNGQIAKAMVAIADMVSELKKSANPRIPQASRPMPQQFAPQMQMPPRMPAPQFQPPMAQQPRPMPMPQQFAPQMQPAPSMARSAMGTQPTMQQPRSPFDMPPPDFGMPDMDMPPMPEKKGLFGKLFKK